MGAAVVKWSELLAGDTVIDHARPFALLVHERGRFYLRYLDLLSGATRTIMFVNPMVAGGVLSADYTVMRGAEVVQATGEET